MIYPVIEDHNSFYFETETQNKISVVFNDLTLQFEASFPIFCVDIYRIESRSLPNRRVNEFSITPREIFFSETESYSFLIIRKSYTNADSIIEAFDNFIKLANETDN